MKAKGRSFAPERSKTRIALPCPMERTSEKVSRGRSSDAIELDKLLHFSQQLYAHALTLQEVVRRQGEVRYEALRPICDRQAAQQFAVFYQTFKRLLGYRKPGPGSRIYKSS
jgi:hypothetical protein